MCVHARARVRNSNVIRTEKCVRQRAHTCKHAFSYLNVFLQILNWAAVRDLGLSATSRQIRQTNQVVSGVAAPGQQYSAVPICEVKQPVAFLSSCLRLASATRGREHVRRGGGGRGEGVRIARPGQSCSAVSVC